MKSTNPKKKNIREDESLDNDMVNSALHELFLNELKDIYWAEKHLVVNLPKMAEKATSEELRNAIELHFKETEGHVERLEQVFKSLNEKVAAKRCEAMVGLVEEAEETIDETEEGSIVRDVAIISCAQKVEHYEIATYGTLRTLAMVMGHKEAEELFAATLAEEKGADETLTEIAETYINEKAKVEHR